MEEKAREIEALSEEELRRLKCNKMDRFEPGKTMQSILDDAVGQLKNYIDNIKEDYEISAFVIFTIGSRRLLWARVI